MSGIVTTIGIEAFAERLVAGLFAASWEIGLYKKPFTPRVTSIITDLTEADYPGYARVFPDGWAEIVLGPNRARFFPNFGTPPPLWGGTSPTPLDMQIFGWFLFNNSEFPFGLVAVQPILTGPILAPWAGHPISVDLNMRLFAFNSP